MPSIVYLITAIALGGLITVLLRALPFAVLAKLRRASFVKKMGVWMPVGIMLILAAVTAADEFRARPHTWWITLLSIVVTIGVHLLTKRRTVWSVLAGTACYVSLLHLVS